MKGKKRMHRFAQVPLKLLAQRHNLSGSSPNFNGDDDEGLPLEFPVSFINCVIWSFFSSPLK